MPDYYDDLFMSIFGEIDMVQSPSVIYTAINEGNPIGFMSGYLHSMSTFFIQYGGIVKDFKGTLPVIMFKEVLTRIHEQFQFILTLCVNDNIPAIKLFLHSGFKIIGTRQATDNKLYIEFLKEKSWGS